MQLLWLTHPELRRTLVASLLPSLQLRRVDAGSREAAAHAAGPAWTGGRKRETWTARPRGRPSTRQRAAVGKVDNGCESVPSAV